ncbi:MAG: transcription elongation factor GreA [Anaerolineae bacterium]|nr:transcription elongation factor GreA [Anaerolineae bacterium]
MATEEPVYLTEEGAAKLRAELEELVNVRRPALANKLKEAREMGDLSENADYTDAKEQQGFLEGRIQQIEYMLRAAKIITDEDRSSSMVHVGSRVTVVEDGSDEPEAYVIVGVAEASPAEGKISNESPMGRALMGRGVGEMVVVEAPAGPLRFKIKAIS